MGGVVTHYLEMTKKSGFIDKGDSTELVIEEAKIKDYRFNKFLYSWVGENWTWTDKLSLSNTDWQSYSENKNLRTWVAYNQGSIAGYYELQKQADDNIEIAYFGLTPNFIRKGLGGYLLSHAIRNAWGWGNTKRVWVHTCTLDHKNALSNYKSRGLNVYKIESS
ncbi:MAG: GNAT family N-acetyltransferase [Pseudomonadales bacterium]|nr:GNAT family N-acetyltransferase [Pseudomonadales bacterium]